MKQNYYNLKHIGLQFFAEPTDPPADPPKDPPTDPPKDPPAGKTYTQDQINSMMANEKRTARQAIFTSLGIEVKEGEKVEDVLAGIKKTLDAGKTQQQLDSEAKKAAETALSQEKQKSTRLEMQVAALKAGVNPNCVDDVITLAAGKVNETTGIDKVLEDLKTKYPSFFSEENSGGSGTGNPGNPKRQAGSDSDGLGKRLAEASKRTTKSSYFKN